MASGGGHRVAVLAYDRMSAFETGIVTGIFGLRWPGLDEPRYELTICAERPNTPVAVVGGATLQTPFGLDDLASADTVIVPSVTDATADPSPEVSTALRLAHTRGARLVSICSGTFALAGAGLLDGRRATTHWQYVDLLRRRFPAVEVDPSPLYVDAGRILTSAGCAAGLDLCLHLVRRDYGGAVANALARRLVIQPHRDGGQAQYIETPMTSPDDNRITRTMEWALRHLGEPITVATLARHAAMSPRTYLRHFAQSTGTSPMRWLIAQRIQASLQLLETTTASIDEVAAAVGFDRAVTYRHHFGRAMRTSPSAYRRAFRDADGGTHRSGPGDRASTNLRRVSALE